jgi:ABC-type lipoprotein export system ATPase subunit
MISLSKICKTYYKPGQAPVRALQDINLDIARGECVAILGPSGSGKSTLMNMLGLLDAPDTGSYRLQEREVAGLKDHELAGLRNRTIGFVFQAFHLLPRTTALENVQLPLLYSNTVKPVEKSLAALAAVGLSDRSKHFTHELSGGQQQRVAIARALYQEPKALLADEPVASVDPARARDLVALLTRLAHEEGLTLVASLHDLELAREFFPRIVGLRGGAVTYDGGGAGLTADIASGLYQPAGLTLEDVGA